MKANLITLQYDESPITFNHDGWFNATQAAERYGKQPHDWLRLPDTQAYLAALQRKYGKISYLKTKRGNQGGTWLHPKLAVRFAQWLDMDFAIWCDEQIDSLLRGQTDWRKLRHEAASSHKVMCAMLKLVRDESGKETESHHYSNEARLVNWALTGVFQGLDRESLTGHDLAVLAKLEEQNAILIGRGVDYRFRKPALETLARVLLQPALAA